MQNKDGRKKENKQGQYQATILTEQIGQLPFMIYYVAITKSDLVGQSVKRAR